MQKLWTQPLTFPSKSQSWNCCNPSLGLGYNLLRIFCSIKTGPICKTPIKHHHIWDRIIAQEIVTVIVGTSHQSQWFLWKSLLSKERAEWGGMSLVRIKWKNSRWTQSNKIQPWKIPHTGLAKIVGVFVFFLLVSDKRKTMEVYNANENVGESLQLRLTGILFRLLTHCKGGFFFPALVSFCLQTGLNFWRDATVYKTQGEN